MSSAGLDIKPRSEAQAVSDEWVAAMRAHRDAKGSFKLLPSEAAKIVGDRRGLTVETVLLMVGSTEKHHDAT